MLAEPRAESIAVGQAGVRRAEGERRRARAGLFPQLSASGSYDRSLASEFEDVFGTTGGPSCAPFVPDPSASLETRVAEIERAVDCGATGASAFGDTDLSELPFGRENTWRATLTFSQNLYSGGRNGAQIALAAAGQEAAHLSLTSTRAQFLYEVTEAYYNAVLSDRLVSIAEATLEQAGATLRQAQAALDAGTQPEFEVLRARVSRDNQSPVVIRQRVNRDVALLRLKQLLDLPVEYDLRLADSLAEETLPPAPVFAARVGPVESAMSRLEPTAVSLVNNITLPDRTVVAEAAAAVRQGEASMRLTEAQKMPSLTVNSSYSRIAYPSNVLQPTFDRSNWTIGVSAQVPILTGGRQAADEAVARATLEQSQARLRQTQELAALDTRSVAAELLAARAAWEATAGTVQQATRAYEIADVRYRAGVSTQLELSDSRLQLQQAEANRAQAARDLQVARARVALLPDLPLGTTGVAAAPPPPPQVPAQPAATGGDTRNAAVQTPSTQVGTR